jgi:hypothetical protein
MGRVSRRTALLGGHEPARRVATFLNRRVDHGPTGGLAS